MESWNTGVLEWWRTGLMITNSLDSHSQRIDYDWVKFEMHPENIHSGCILFVSLHSRFHCQVQSGWKSLYYFCKSARMPSMSRYCISFDRRPDFHPVSIGLSLLSCPTNILKIRSGYRSWCFEWKKLQAPNNKQNSNSKFQWSKQVSTWHEVLLRSESKPNVAFQRRPNCYDSLSFVICFGFEFCNLEFICNLKFEFYTISFLMRKYY